MKLGTTAFKPTGTLPNVDPRTGKPMANPSFEMGPGQTATEIALRYLDANGIESPVTVRRFDPRLSLIQGMRDILDRSQPAGWPLAPDITSTCCITLT